MSRFSSTATRSGFMFSDSIRNARVNWADGGSAKVRVSPLICRIIAGQTSSRKPDPEPEGALVARGHLPARLKACPDTNLVRTIGGQHLPVNIVGRGHLYSALRKANLRVTVRPSWLACTITDESGKSDSSTSKEMEAPPAESVTAWV